MESVDAVIVGAGVIGLAVASEVARPERNVFVLEKNESWGQETSSRNSEVIHAGLYYPPATLKALCCLQGRNALYELCPKHGIGIRKTGKLIVATSDAERVGLEKVYQTAAQNGVELHWLDAATVKKMEPQVSCVAALYSPETGIVDSHALMKFFLEAAQSRGAEVAYRAEVIGIERAGACYKVRIDNQGEAINLTARIVVNCAGLYADKIAAQCGIAIEAAGYEQSYIKGSYFRLSDAYRNATQHLIYPVPLQHTLGIHTVLDLRGGLRLGPDDEEAAEIDYRVTEARKKGVYEAAKKFLPFIGEDSLTADMAGIRPQLRRANTGGFKDFIIAHEADRGLPGLINLIGIESPGLTASPYIGKYVADMVEEVLA